MWQNQFGANNLVLRLLAASPLAPSNMSKSLFEIQRRLEVEQTFTEVAHPEELNPFPITLMAWVKIEGGGDQRQNLISKLQQDPQSGYSIHLDAGRLRAQYIRNEVIAIGAAADGLDGGFIADGNWHHIAFSVDESGAVLFVDCAVKAEAGWNTVQRGFNGLGGECNGSAPLVIGGAQVPPAAIDEISLWSKSMDAEEILLKRAISENSERVDLIWYKRALLPLE
jgi:hypothetical protein